MDVLFMRSFSREVEMRSGTSPIMRSRPAVQVERQGGIPVGLRAPGVHQRNAKKSQRSQIALRLPAAVRAYRQESWT
jgi:hypothetical protein